MKNAKKIFEKFGEKVTSPLVKRILEIRYDSVYDFFDIRGKLFKELSELFLPIELGHYSMAINRNSLIDKNRTLAISVTEKNCVIATESLLEKDIFLDQSKKLIDYFLNKSSLYDKSKLVRIGVRSAFVHYSPKSFDALTILVRNKYGNISSTAESIYNKANIIDVGIPLRLEKENYFANTSVGAMEKDQFINFIDPQSKLISENIPKQGLYAEFDLYVKEGKLDKLLESSNLDNFVTETVEETNLWSEEIKKLILD